MSILIGLAMVICLFLAGSFVLVFRKLAAAGNLPMDQDWVEQVSAARYRPLGRLLDEREYGALRRHPACSRRMLRRFRTLRVEVFRSYLCALSVDHSRLCRAVSLLMVQSAQDRPDLARLLVRQRLAFTLHLMLAEFRLSLHALGASHVDAGKLVAALDSMRLELHGLLAATAAAAA
jgi:hypothetical protein